MDAPPNPHVASVESMDDGLVISFDNGQSAFYPSALLYSILAQAKEIDTREDSNGF
jgi:hypothetical protein